MEFPPYPNDEDDDVTHVWNIFHQKIGAIHRPTVVNCSSKKTLQHQVVQIILNSQKLEPRFKESIKLLVDQGLHPNFDRIMTVFRKAQLENKELLDFDMWWDDEPQVLL